MKSLQQLVSEAHHNAVDKGFHERIPTFGVPGPDTRHILSWLALIVSEVAEGMEAVRLADRANFEEELADACIRIFDVCGALGINLQEVIEAKMARNASRPRLHGGKLA